MNPKRNHNQISSTTRRIAGLITSCALLWLSATSASQADTINQYDTDLIVNSDGSVSVVERIVYSFTGEARHGINRDLPLTYTQSDGQVVSLPLEITTITDEAGAALPFEIQTPDEDLLRVHIGDPDVEITGQHTYVLAYTIHGVIIPHDVQSKQATLLWDVIGDGWDATVQAATVTVNLPPGEEVPAVDCFTGLFNSLLGDCMMQAAPAMVTGELTAPLDSYSNWTIRVDLPKKRFTMPGTLVTALSPRSASPTITIDGLEVPSGAIRIAAGDHILAVRDIKYEPIDKAITLRAGETLELQLPLTRNWIGRWIDLYVPLILVIGAPLGTFLLWWHWGRDPKGRATIIAEYEAPDDLPATAVGVMVDQSVDKADLTCGIIELAMAGALEINVEENDGWNRLFQKNTITLNKLAAGDDLKLTAYQRTLLDAIFPTGYTSADMHDLSTRLPTVWPKFKEKLWSLLMGKKYFHHRPERVKAIVLALGIVVTTGGIVLGGFIMDAVDNGIYMVIFAVLGILIMLISRIMPQRTQEGQLVYQHILGLKQFLTVTETLRMAKMQHPDRFTDEQTTFEYYLPYAIALRVEKAWLKRFPDVQSPTWYHGNGAFTTALLLSNLSHIQTTARSATGSGSGVGGGGFAGGGFGGGGGGSW